VVGGLGLGYTVKALLADQRIERVDVIEIEPLLVDWLRADLVPGTAAILSDRRVRVTIGDVAGTFADAAPGSYDVALLDVDNGPDFLVHERNATVYQEGVLSAAGRALRPGGILAVWSAAPSESLSERLAATVGPVEEVTAAVTRGGRALSYSLYLATATPADR
jgi:spermidine synthase